MLNKSGSPSQKEKAQAGDDSSSSLLDLDHNDWNITSDMITTHTRTLRSKQPQDGPPEEQIHTVSQSPYMVGGPATEWTKVGNFKSRKSVADGNDITISSGEGAEGQESELIESVHLSCSENLNDEAGSASKHDSDQIIQMIENVAS